MMHYGFVLFMSPVRLVEPWWLLLFLPLLLVCLFRGTEMGARLFLPGSNRLPGQGIRVGRLLAAAETILLVAACTAGIVAMAGPEVRDVRNAATGADVMLVIDASASMLEEDAQGVSRFERCRNVALSWVAARQEGRTGLVLFRGDPFLVSPLTGDHAVLADILRQTDPGGITREGTAAGSALMFALRRLETAGSERLIMLFSDGEHNLGPLDPGIAVEDARAGGVGIFTFVPAAAADVPQWLEDAAALTGGATIRLGDIAGGDSESGMLPGSTGFYGAWFGLYPGSSLSSVFLVLALSLIALAIVLGNTRLLKVP